MCFFVFLQGILDRWAHVQRGSTRAHDHANTVLPPMSVTVCLSFFLFMFTSLKGCILSFGIYLFTYMYFISQSHAGVMEEVVAGMEAGTCFGYLKLCEKILLTFFVQISDSLKVFSFCFCRMAAVVSRLGFMLVEKGHSPLCIPGGILGGVVCSASGFFCQVKIQGSCLD